MIGSRVRVRLGKEESLMQQKMREKRVAMLRQDECGMLEEGRTSSENYS